MRGVPGFGMPLGPQTRRPSPIAVYASVVSVGVFGSMSWRWFAGLAATLARHTAGQQLSFAFFLAWALGVTGCVTLALRAVGPFALSRQALTWCLSSPGVSEVLHRRSLWSRILAAVVAGGLAGIAAAVAWPVSDWPVRILTMVGAALIGVALVAITAAEQIGAPGEGCRSRLVTTRVVGAAGVLAGLLIWYLASYGVITVGSGGALGPVGAGAVVVSVLGLVCRRRVRVAATAGSVPLGELHRAGDIVDRVTASAVMLTAVCLEPAPRRRGRIRVTACARLARGTAGWLALLDIRRVLARWPELAVAAILVPLVGSVTHVAGHGWGCVVLTVLAYGLASRLARWFVAWDASPSLRYLVPFGDRSTRVALLAAPVLGVLVLATAAVGLAGLSPWWIGSSLVCALVGIGRRIVATRRGADFALLVSTGMGPLPLNLGLRLTSGWDAAVLGGLLGFVLPDAAVLPVVVIAALLNAAWVRAGAAWTGRRRASGESWPSRLVRWNRGLPRVDA